MGRDRRIFYMNAKAVEGVIILKFPKKSQKICVSVQKKIGRSFIISTVNK